MIVDTLTLEIAGTSPTDLPLEEFVTAINNLRGLLLALDTGKTLTWNVTKISMKSPCQLATAATPKKEKFNSGVADKANRIVRDVYERRSPKKASKTAIRYARGIVAVLTHGISRVSLTSPKLGKSDLKKKLRAVSKSPIPLVIAPPQEREYYADVELTGILETATTALGEPVLHVRDPLNNHKTICDLPRDLFNRALDAMKKDSPRVAVFGRARYAGGYPASIQVETLEVLPTIEDHPGFFAVQGIDITGGMDAVDYLRSIRGA